MMAEYCVMHILALERKLAENAQKQQRKEWGTRGAVAQASYRTLNNLTLGILGIGDIGKEVARVAKEGFNMRVMGCRKSSGAMASAVPCVDEMHTLDDLSTFLAKCDYVVSLLPSTQETRGLLGRVPQLALIGRH